MSTGDSSHESMTQMARDFDQAETALLAQVQHQASYFHCLAIFLIMLIF